MNARKFAEECFLLKEDLKKEYLTRKDSEVSRLSQQLGLEESTWSIYEKIIDSILTDCMYSLLLGLDGCAAIGTTQQEYELRDEDGNLVFSPGELEIEAWEVFKDVPEGTAGK